MAATLDFDNLVLGTSATNLKCFNCDNLLSFFPIYISKDKRNVCGRCYELKSLQSEKDKYVHNEAYETIAQFVHFPCRYKEEGCLKKLLPADMVNHEELCPFRRIKCPTIEFTDCDWEGALSTTFFHCHDKHNNIMLKSGEFDMNLAEGHNCNNLFESDSALFIITRKFYAINKLLEISICNFGCGNDPKTIPCEIHFKGKDRSLVVSYNATPFPETKVTEVFLDCLKYGDVLPTIHCKISIEQDKAKEQTDVVMPKTLNLDLLSRLKCSTCLNYALPPIYQKTPSLISLTGQNELECYECKQKPRPVINLGFGTTKNSSNESEICNEILNWIVNQENYPCKFDKNGCSFVAKPEAMKKHQEFCPFGSYPCPLAEYIECHWVGFGKEITRHIENNHTFLFKTMSSEISERRNDSSSSSPVKCYVIKFSDKLFQVNYQEKQDHFYWSVRLIGETDKQYMYELEIIDPYNRNKRLTIKQPCSSYKKKNELFTYVNDSYCYFNKNQIVPFPKGIQNITFKITIFE